MEVLKESELGLMADEGELALLDLDVEVGDGFVCRWWKL
jgi:hypothetical protein